MKRSWARRGGRRGWMWLAALAMAAPMGAPSVARAQEVTSDDVAVRDAKARFEEGLKRYESGDFEGARVAFQQAYSVLHAVDILYNLSLSELRSGRPVEALHHLQEYLKDKRPSEEERAKASKFLAEAHSKTGHVFVDAPEGAAVLMDDQALDRKAPLTDPIDVTAGKHVCTIRLDGKTQTAEVIANPGQSVTVRFTAGEKAPEVLEGQQQQQGTRTPAAAEAPTDSGAWPMEKIITVSALGAGAVGAVVAGALFVSGAKSNQDDAQGLSAQVSCAATPTSPLCGQIADKKSAYDSDRTLSTVMFTAGGVLAAGAVAAAVLWPNEGASSAPQKGTRLVPVVTAGGASLVWSGRF